MQIIPKYFLRPQPTTVTQLSSIGLLGSGKQRGRTYLYLKEVMGLALLKQNFFVVYDGHVSKSTVLNSNLELEKRTGDDSSNIAMSFSGNSFGPPGM